MSINDEPLIAYRRVSTRRQGASGLGLEAQEAAVSSYAAGRTVLASYTEVESGRRSDRPELLKALAHARRSRATIVIAKWDRLGRNLAFLSALLDSGVDFVAVDNPHANRLTIHILAAVAQHEAEMISTRTRDALAAAKARGTLLGSARPGHWAGREDQRMAGLGKATAQSATVRHQAAISAYADILPQVLAQRQAGASLKAIAARLNATGHTTRTGCRWSAVQVRRVIVSVHNAPSAHR